MSHCFCTIKMHETSDERYINIVLPGKKISSKISKRARQKTQNISRRGK